MGEEISPELLQAIEKQINISTADLTATVTKSVTDAITSSLSGIVNAAVQKAMEGSTETTSTTLVDVNRKLSDMEKSLSDNADLTKTLDHKVIKLGFPN